VIACECQKDKSLRAIVECGQRCPHCGKLAPYYETPEMGIYTFHDMRYQLALPWAMLGACAQQGDNSDNVRALIRNCQDVRDQLDNLPLSAVKAECIESGMAVTDFRPQDLYENMVWLAACELADVRKARLEEAKMPGPGLDSYAYNADEYCIECAHVIMDELDYIPHPEDVLFRDSETLPQPVCFGSDDTARHCGQCGGYLYGGGECEVEAG